MTFRVIRAKADLIALRNDDDDEVLTFAVQRGAAEELALQHDVQFGGPTCGPIWIEHAREVAEVEAKRLGWL
jgi:hypothetical protein